MERKRKGVMEVKMPSVTAKVKVSKADLYNTSSPTRLRCAITATRTSALISASWSPSTRHQSTLQDNGYGPDYSLIAPTHGGMAQECADVVYPSKLSR